MKNGPKTIEEARALPELSLAEEFSTTTFLGSDGIDGDSIILFVDEDGITKMTKCIRRETKNASDEWVKIIFTGI